MASTTSPIDLQLPIPVELVAHDHDENGMAVFRGVALETTVKLVLVRVHRAWSEDVVIALEDGPAGMIVHPSDIVGSWTYDDDRRSPSGQGLAEYALLLALIAIVAIVALLFLGNQISGVLSTVGTQV